MTTHLTFPRIKNQGRTSINHIDQEMPLTWPLSASRKVAKGLAYQFNGHCLIMKLQSKFTETPNEMSYAVIVKDQCSSPLEDSDDESLFCHRASPAQETTSRKIWINKRLIGRRNLWTRTEQQSYLIFLKEQFDLLQRHPQEQLKLKIYRLMQKYIISKNYAQCRVHHQRMLSEYKDIESTIKGCERRLKGRFGRIDKMQQYKGLRVELDSEDEGTRTVDEKQIWDVVGRGCWSYYQKETEEGVSTNF